MGTRPASYAQRIHLFPRNQQRPVTPETPLGFPPRLCIRKPHLGRREISPPNVRSQAEHLLAPPIVQTIAQHRIAAFLSSKTDGQPPNPVLHVFLDLPTTQICLHVAGHSLARSDGLYDRGATGERISSQEYPGLGGHEGVGVHIDVSPLIELEIRILNKGLKLRRLTHSRYHRVRLQGVRVTVGRNRSAAPALVRGTQFHRLTDKSLRTDVTVTPNWRQEYLELNTLLPSLLYLPVVRRHLLLRPTIHDLDVRRAQAHRSAGRINGRIASSHDSDLVADGHILAESHSSQKINGIHAPRQLLAGNAHLLSLMSPHSDEGAPKTQ